MSDVRLKIPHTEGPNHEPEFNRAKPPAQGDLPVLEQRNTVPVVRDKGALSLTRYSLTHSWASFIIYCLHSPPGMDSITMTPEAVAKEEPKSKLPKAAPSRDQILLVTVANRPLSASGDQAQTLNQEEDTLL